MSKDILPNDSSSGSEGDKYNVDWNDPDALQSQAARYLKRLTEGGSDINATLARIHLRQATMLVEGQLQQSPEDEALKNRAHKLRDSLSAVDNLADVLNTNPGYVQRLMDPESRGRLPI